MNNIEKLLKETLARLSYGDTWLVWYENKWTVFSKPYGKHKIRTLYSGDNLDAALIALKPEKR